MKRLFALFVAILLFFPMAFTQKMATGQVKTVVIDPGHGGEKPGATRGDIKEKDITLSIALKLGKLINDNFPDVNVIYTRKTDVDIALAERAHIANRAKADLFISIHANSHRTPNPSGVETFVMGLSQSKANMEVAITENADILLEPGYKDNSDYQGFDPNSPESFVMFAMYQNAFINKSLNFAKFVQDQYMNHTKMVNRGVKQAELFVLYKTTMPSVLTEVGFLSNPTEAEFISSEEGQATIAVALFHAFSEYKTHEEAIKPLKKPVIDIPGYGKNTSVTTKTQALVAKAHADSLAVVDSLARVARVADSLARVARTADSLAKIRMADSIADSRRPKVSYRVQFLCSDEKLEEGDKKFNGVTGYDHYVNNERHCYTMGNVRDMQAVKVILRDIRAKGFDDAFIIAFYKGKRIGLQEAREIENSNN